MDQFPKTAPEAIVSAIQFHAVAMPNGLHVIVEGDDDVAFFKRLFRECDRTIRWHNACGRPNVFRVHRLCGERKISRVFFVVDADWHRRLGTIEEWGNVAYTDRNDMECTVLSLDPVLERLQGVFVSHAQANAFLVRCGRESLFRAVVDRAARIGRYRFINHRDKLNLAFKNPKPCTEPPYDAFLTNDCDIAWDDEAFRTWVAARNCGNPGGVASLFQSSDELSEPGDDLLDWCQGHDLLAIHAVLHSRLAGTPYDSECAGRQLEGVVRDNAIPSRTRNAIVFQRLEGFLGWRLPSEEIA